jgi:hypothetical protein
MMNGVSFPQPDEVVAGSAIDGDRKNAKSIVKL